MPLGLGRLEGAGGAQDAVLGVKRADDLQSDRQPGIGQASATGPVSTAGAGNQSHNDNHKQGDKYTLASPAKKEGETLTGVEVQAERYSEGLPGPVPALPDNVAGVPIVITDSLSNAEA